MKIKNFIGTWRTQDFPNFAYTDNRTFQLHITGNLIATLWYFDNNGKNGLIVEGKISITEGENDNFILSIDNIEINCRLLMLQKPASFIILIPEYGERYIQKLEK